MNLSLVLAVGIFCGTSTADEKPLPWKGEASIGEIAEEIRERHGVPALAVAAIDSKGAIASAVVGVLSHGGDENATKAHAFHIGSCTKAVTATLIAYAVDEGLLDWTTTVEDVYPDGGIADVYRTVTLLDLLGHTSGLVPGTSGAEAFFQVTGEVSGAASAQRKQMVPLALNMDPVGPRGEHVYSNVGYGIAGAMLEEVSGESWEEHLERLIFKPLRCQNSGIGWPASSKKPNEPLGHRRGSKGFEPLPIGHDYKLGPVIAPAGDVHMSVEDFVKFAGLHLRALRGEEASLSSETIETLHRPIADRYACGWVTREIAGEKAQWHNGSAGTFMAWMTVWKDHDLAVVAAMNAGGPQVACQEATERVFGVLRGGAN